MIDYRLARSDEYTKIVDLANLSFGFNLEHLIPRVYGSRRDPSMYHRIAINECGKICSQVAVLPEKLSVCGSTINVGWIGIVSTHPDERGKGFMKSLMNSSIEDSAQKYDMLALYGQRQRYEYFGFTQGSVRLKHTVTQANVNHSLKDDMHSVVEFQTFVDTDDLVAVADQINQKRLSFVYRELDLLPMILNSFNQHTLGILYQGKCIGYLTVNENGDEISEIGLLENKYIRSVIKSYILKNNIQRMVIHTPDYENDLNSALGCFSDSCVFESSEMYHIFDYYSVIQGYLNLKKKSMTLTHGVFSAVFDGQPLTISVDDSGVSIIRSAIKGAIELNKSDAQTLLLSTYSRYMDVSVPKDWFPLPIFWYIADRF